MEEGICGHTNLVYAYVRAYCDYSRGSRGMTTCAVEGFGRPVGPVVLRCVDGSRMGIEAETKQVQTGL